MIILRLETLDFRNLANQTVEPGPHFNILSGDNAQGKTNFLEAVYLVSSLRSFRAKRTIEMIAFKSKKAKIRSKVQSCDLTNELMVMLQPGKKRAILDGKRAVSTSKYLERLNVVLFAPEDVQIPRGRPEARRRLLDTAVVTLWPAYIKLSQDYQKVLQSRNRVLRERPVQINHLLDVYDQQLANIGGKILAGRIRYIKGMQPRLREVFGQISQSGVEGKISYKAPESILEAGDNVSQLTTALKSCLEERRKEDQARKTTSKGPHTDDVDFWIDGQTTRSFGSQGQLRTLILSYKIAQIEDICEKLGQYPVLLLDDVSSELDSERNKYLFDFLKKIPCQSFITTTRSDFVMLANERMDYQVVRGKIRPKD